MSEAAGAAGAAAAGTATGTATGQAGAAAAGGSGTADWTAGFSPELKGYVEKAQFKDPASVVDAYQNLEKLMGVPKDRLLKLPEKLEGDAMKEIYGRLGRPEKAEEYKLPVPEGQDGEFAKLASGWFHELGLSRSQAVALTTKWNEHFGKQGASQAEAAQLAAKDAETALKKEWGSAFDQNVKLVDAASIKLGFTAEQVDALGKTLGRANALKWIHGLATKMGEADFVSGDGGGSGNRTLTPAAAQMRISELRQDSDFIRKYTAGDVSAKEEMERLHRLAHPA